MHLLAALINLGQLEQANQLFDELDIEAIVAQTQAAKVGTWIETKTLALSMLLEHMIDLRPSDQRMLLVVQAVRRLEPMAGGEPPSTPWRPPAL